MLLLSPMFKAGLVLKRGPTDNVFDAIRKGYPVQQLPGRAVEVPATVGQQEASAVAQQEQAKLPDVVSPGPSNTCPPGYTFALGYCVRNVNYYGCIPGVEFWDGTKCSRNWPKCADGIMNDLNTGECIGQGSPETTKAFVEDTVDTMQKYMKEQGDKKAATTEAFVQGTNDNLQNYIKNEAGKPSTTETFITDTNNTAQNYLQSRASEALPSSNPALANAVLNVDNQGNLTVSGVNQPQLQSSNPAVANASLNVDNQGNLTVSGVKKQPALVGLTKIDPLAGFNITMPDSVSSTPTPTPVNPNVANASIKVDDIGNIIVNGVTYNPKDPALANASLAVDNQGNLTVVGVEKRQAAETSTTLTGTQRMLSGFAEALELARGNGSGEAGKRRRL